MLKSSVVRSSQICLYIHRWDAAEGPRGSAVKLFIYESGYYYQVTAYTPSAINLGTVVHCIWNM